MSISTTIPEARVLYKNLTILQAFWCKFIDFYDKMC